MKTHRPFIPALAAFGMMALSAPASAQLAGNIRSVDADAKTLVVTGTPTGVDTVVTIGERAPIVTAEGEALRLRDLRKGDGVSVTLDGAVATRVVVNPIALIAGVKSVDPDARKLVVTRPGSDRQITVPVDARTAITTADGKALKLNDLKEGDAVSVVPARGTAAKILVNVRPDELVGHVESVAANFETFVVKETGTNKKFTLTVNDATTIVTAEGKNLKVKDLKKGDGLGILHTGGVAKRITVEVKTER